MMTEVSPFLAACLTPPGSAAIAVLALRGADAWNAAAKHFVPLRGHLPPWHQVKPGSTWLGRLGRDVTDEVFLVVKQTTPTPWLEVHCHGGRVIVACLLDLFVEEGGMVCSWQELDRRTTGDILQALAAAELARASTVRTAGILLDQYHGALARAIEAIQADLESHRLAEARRRLDALMTYQGLGRRLVEPWRVVVAGAVNAGKSSLVNALVGYQRSIVAPLAGTTRDVVTARVAVDGWPIELADTAGLRQTTEHLEEQGMHLSQKATAEADLCLWLLDATTEPTWPGPGVRQPLLVINKIDQPPAWDLGRAGNAVRVSALTGEGLADLAGHLSFRLVPEPPPAGAAVPFTSSLVTAIAEALHGLNEGQAGEAAALLGRWAVSSSPTP